MTGYRRTHESFEEVAALLLAFAEADDRLSAQLAVWHRGEPVVDMAVGLELSNVSLTGVFSASKGISAITLARLLDQDLLRLDASVAHYWPEFGTAGKESVTVGALLAHQTGLPVVEKRLTIADLTDPSTADLLASQRPLWEPGSAFGYHAVTIGILMEELVRRVTGASLQELYEWHIRRPLGADFYLGLPEAEDHRYVPVREAQPTGEQAAEILARPAMDAIAAAVFDNVAIPSEFSTGVGLSTNIPELRRSGSAAIGGVGSAAGLAAVYAATLSSSPAPIASETVFAQMAVQRSWGLDRVLNVANCFGAVFMLPQPRMPFGGVGAYGHDGAGGVLAFADPTTQVAFAYVPSPMQYPGGADARSVELAQLVHRLAATRPHS
ncbi:serine hydrolase domain-containing protein [Parafrigoribacterium soli]|uniref:serine hydrolase domain-containing protein n=1 Tax=Parafrigoribacterium soli TaxID=3144663 RepID=UPI0032EF01EB